MIPHTEAEKEHTWFVEGLTKFKERHPELEVRFESMIGGELPGKLTTYLAAGEVPDLVMMMQRDLGKMISTDSIVDLNHYLAIDKELKKSDLVQAYLDDWTRNGKLLGMPINMDTGYIHYNIERLGEAGIPLLRQTWPNGDWTWADFRAIAQKLTKDTNGDGTIDVYGYSASYTWEPVWMSYVYSNGGYVYDINTKKSGLREPAAYNALQWLYDLRRDNILAPFSPAATNHHQWSLTTLHGGWGQYAVTSGYNYASFPHPSPSPQQQAVHVLLGPGLVIFRDAKHPDLAWELIKILESPESMARLSILTGRLGPRPSVFSTWTASYEQKIQDGHWVISALQTAKGMPYNSHWADMRIVKWRNKP